MKQDSPHFSLDLHMLTCWLLLLFPWWQSADTRARQEFSNNCNSVCCLCMGTKCSTASALTAAACLLNRSANSAFCALLVSLVMGTSMWWTFSLRCRENCNFFPPPCLPHPPTPSPLITPSFSPLAPSHTHIVVIALVVLESRLNADAELGEEWYLRGDKR